MLTMNDSAPNWRSCMAAGIYDDQGRLVAGLSVSAPADRLDESWITKLQATASEISAALGFDEQRKIGR